jgi:hypothetical protein
MSLRRDFLALAHEGQLTTPNWPAASALAVKQRINGYSARANGSRTALAAFDVWDADVWNAHEIVICRRGWQICGRSGDQRNDLPHQ